MTTSKRHTFLKGLIFTMIFFRVLSNFCYFPDRLLEKTIIIQVSDVKGLSHCNSRCTCAITIPENIEPVRTFDLAPPFQRFGYEVKDNQSRALIVKAELMNYFQKEYLKK
jgi:hypothetical protein